MKIEKEIKLLKIYTLTTTIVFAYLLFASFASKNNNQKFEEIDVERINIVEKDGQLKMVISNRERQHPGISNGEIIKRDYKRPPGIIFFNQVGDEMGGLIYGDNGDTGHFGSLTWDKFNGDQTIGFRHLENDGEYSSGLFIWQQPNIPGAVMVAKLDSIRNIKDAEIRKSEYQKMRDKNLLTSNRLYLGKNRQNASILKMNDIKGKERIIMQVDSVGNPTLKFLDEMGSIIYSIPK